MSDSTEVAVRDTRATQVREQLTSGGPLRAIIPQDAEQAYRMAEMIVKSGMAPKDMATPQQVVAAIFHGAEIGLAPMQAVQSIAVVNGRPTVWGDAAIGLVQASGLLEDFEERIDGTGESMKAVCRAKRRDNPSPIMREFTVGDAKAAGLWNKAGPWKNYPKRMLQMRARSWVLRDGFADILKGTHIREEVMDYQHPATAAVHSDTPTASADALRAQAEGKEAEQSTESTERAPDEAPPSQEAALESRTGDQAEATKANGPSVAEDPRGWADEVLERRHVMQEDGDDAGIRELAGRLEPYLDALRAMDEHEIADEVEGAFGVATETPAASDDLGELPLEGKGA